MNKGTLIRAVAQRTGWSLAEAQDSVDVVLDELAHAIVRQETVQITGFGTFSVYEEAARQRTNPQNGEKVDVPARDRVKFRPAVRLLEHVRGERIALKGGRVIGKKSRAAKKD